MSSTGQSKKSESMNWCRKMSRRTAATKTIRQTRAKRLFAVMGTA